MYINAYPVTIPPTQTVVRIPVPDPATSRRELERRHRARLFLHEGAAWTAQPIDGQGTVELAAEEHLPVHLFNLREALRLRARELGWEFWISKGEMNTVRPGVRETVGPFVIQSVLKARAVWEGTQVRELLLVASSSVRWLVDQPLTDDPGRGVAVGESVLRRAGTSGGPPRGRVAGFDGDKVLLADRDGGLDRAFPASDYQLVARPSLVFKLLLQRQSYQDASRVYAELLAASGTLRREDRRTPNQYAAKERFVETEQLLNDFGRELRFANDAPAKVATMPREIFVISGPAREPWSATVMSEPRLRFDAAIPSRSDTHAYKGLRKFGAYRLPGLRHEPQLLLAYPSAMHAQAERFGSKLLSGSGNYPGFKRLFGMPDEAAPALSHLRLPSGEQSRDMQRLRAALDRWAAEPRGCEPDLAIVIVPHTDRWVTDTPYYIAKEFFAARGIPSQMVTEELLADTGRLGWSLANIALAAFAKLGGYPWVVDARGYDSDLVVGVGRADIAAVDGERRRCFGYAVAFVSNGAYLATHASPPATDGDYERQLTQAITAALRESRTADLPPTRVIIHLARRTGEREIRAAVRALASSGMQSLPVAFLRIDDSSLFEFLDGEKATFAPPKGLTLRLAERRALVQVETAGTLGPARRPLLIELDERSTIGPEDFGGLVLQVYRLGHANWRGFNARSKPVSLFYGERLAELIGYMDERGEWNPMTMRADLRSRPWFL
ncbi:Piwi domain-containing protein [Actinomadura chokoriensis]|uniref:Piwi domain-containing protein n=1 Tax=Actinomadura chokoriensis TaxID=454156 RepID=UPI0031F7AACB